jgi:hypothetical protein
MERFKNFMRAFSGLIVGFLFIMCAIGSFGYLIMDGHYVFAVANVVAVCFAAKPVKDYFVKNVVL